MGELTFLSDALDGRHGVSVEPKITDDLPQTLHFTRAAPPVTRTCLWPPDRFSHCTPAADVQAAGTRPRRLSELISTDSQTYSLILGLYLGKFFINSNLYEAAYVAL